MVCLGFKPGVAEWKVQMYPLSYGILSLLPKLFFAVVHSPLRSYVTGQPTKHHDREGGINDNDNDDNNNNNMLPLLSMAQQ